MTEIRELARYEVRPESLEYAADRKNAGILYPYCLAPVEFTEYRQVDANTTR